VACPFFMPIQKFENGTWPFPRRLPLGCGWSGQCTAPEHEGETPSIEDLQEFCNLGYAKHCSRLPHARAWDSVRFGVRSTAGAVENAGFHRIQVHYICERGHLPAEHGFLEFSPVEAMWSKRHPDPRVQRMAECFIASYLERRRNQQGAQAAS
jgi:hypothetical protein